MRPPVQQDEQFARDKVLERLKDLVTLCLSDRPILLGVRDRQPPEHVWRRRSHMPFRIMTETMYSHPVSTKLKKSGERRWTKLCWSCLKDQELSRPLDLIELEMYGEALLFHPCVLQVKVDSRSRVWRYLYPRLGICKRDPQVGDEIFVVPGCNLPLILRKNTDQQSQIVTSAVVQGTMHKQQLPSRPQDHITIV